jgi:hypothetical protein
MSSRAAKPPTATIKHSRIAGPARKKLAGELVERYRDGESIRALASATGRSYGFVHQLLTESGVKLRGRGGSPAGRRRRMKA